METTFLLALVFILISIIPLAFYIGKGTGYANGFDDAKQVYKKDITPVTDKKVSQLAQNICNSFKMN